MEAKMVERMNEQVATIFEYQELGYGRDVLDVQWARLYGMLEMLQIVTGKVYIIQNFKVVEK